MNLTKTKLELIEGFNELSHESVREELTTLNLQENNHHLIIDGAVVDNNKTPINIGHLLASLRCSVKVVNSTPYAVEILSQILKYNREELDIQDPNSPVDFNNIEAWVAMLNTLTRHARPVQSYLITLPPELVLPCILKKNTSRPDSILNINVQQLLAAIQEVLDFTVKVLPFFKEEELLSDSGRNLNAAKKYLTNGGSYNKVSFPSNRPIVISNVEAVFNKRSKKRIIKKWHNSAAFWKFDPKNPGVPFKDLFNFTTKLDMSHNCKLEIDYINVDSDEVKDFWESFFCLFNADIITASGHGTDLVYLVYLDGVEINKGYKNRVARRGYLNYINTDCVKHGSIVGLNFNSDLAYYSRSVSAINSRLSHLEVITKLTRPTLILTTSGSLINADPLLEPFNHTILAGKDGFNFGHQESRSIYLPFYEDIIKHLGLTIGDPYPRINDPIIESHLPYYNYYKQGETGTALDWYIKILNRGSKDKSFNYKEELNRSFKSLEFNKGILHTVKTLGHPKRDPLEVLYSSGALEDTIISRGELVS